MAWAFLGKVQIPVLPAMCVCVPKVYLCFLIFALGTKDTLLPVAQTAGDADTQKIYRSNTPSCTTMKIFSVRG